MAKRKVKQVQLISSEFDVFDLACGLDHWLQHNWSGMSDPKYEAYCQLTAPGVYRPSPCETFDNIEGSARMVYDDLTDENYEEALERVLNYKSED